MQTAQRTSVDEKQSELDKIFVCVQDQNNRLVSTILELERLGHKIKDTNFPKEEKDGTVKSPDGLIQQIQLQLEYYIIHNRRLEDFMVKMKDLL